MSEASKFPTSTALPQGPALKYEEDAIYQEGKVVGRVVGAHVRSDAHEVYFAEINGSDALMLAEECEFQVYRVMIQRIEYASRLEKNAPDKGRILRRVVAEILGFREP